MPDFSRVLCAIDLTDSSRRALDCALWWARQHGADVSVLNVRQLVPPAADAPGLADDVISPAATPHPRTYDLQAPRTADTGPLGSRPRR